ncbi:MAG: adenylosuccinate synthetase, partial [archaeon]|nr:adenylosuccinate synthetase [archaeon]
DLVNLKYACMLNDYDHLGIMLVDVMGGLKEVKICTAYKYNGEILDSWPIQSEIIEECEPVYMTMPGWEYKSPEEWSEQAKKGYDALPDTIKNYIAKIEEILEAPLTIVSIGPNRSDTIIRNPIW